MYTKLQQNENKLVIMTFTKDENENVSYKKILVKHWTLRKKKMHYRHLFF